MNELTWEQAIERLQQELGDFREVNPDITGNNHLVIGNEGYSLEAIHYEDNSMEFNMHYIDQGELQTILRRFDNGYIDEDSLNTAIMLYQTFNTHS